MLVKKFQKGYSTQRIYVYGAGFKDNLKSIGSFLVQNKDIIAKPLLGAAAEVGAKVLSEGGKALINHIITKRSKPQIDPKSQQILDSIINKTNLESTQLDPKGQEILQSIIPSVGNIFGSGVKRF